MPATETPSASHYQQLFTEVLKEYKKKTGKDPTVHALVAQLSNCVTPDEVTALLRKQAEEVDEAHRASWRAQLFEGIAPIARVIRPLCDTAGKAAGLAFQPGEVIFGGIGIILAVPDNHVKNHQALLQWFEQMGRCLERLQILTAPGDFLSDKPTLTRVVVDILMELIRILAIVSQKISAIGGLIPRAKRRFKRGIAALFGDNDIDDALRKLDRLATEENRMVTALTSRDIAIVKREQQRQERLQQAERYRRWLSIPNCSTNQAVASKARYSGTSMWLVRGSLYESWRREGTLLWITGKPGAGKTVHCSSVIADLESVHSGGSQPALAYFYCDFRDTQKQSYRNLLASLLVDLSTQSDASSNMLRELYSKHGNGTRDPTDDDLARCLKEIVIHSGGTQYIVVDALDEMPNYGLSSSRGETLGLMKDLIGLRLPDLRICVTSRPEEDISRVLRMLSSQRVVLEEQQEHRDDITWMIRSIIESHEKMQGWGETMKEEAIEALSSKADGMFRYVSCQLETLSECPPAKIHSTLSALPSTLYATYESTLGRISEEKWDHAHRIFQCLSFSRRPLKVEELAEILAIDLSEDIPTHRGDWRSNNAESAILSI